MTNFKDELEELINRYSMENGSNTPDFILAEYLSEQLALWDKVITRRERYYGREPKPVETSPVLTAEQLSILRHALGADSSTPSYRNGFAAEEGADDWPHVMALVEMGLMTRGKTNCDGLALFYVTEEGQELIGVREQL